MAEQVYRVELLQQKIVTLLRKHGTGMTPAAIAQKLELPQWAVNAGLEAAMKGDLVEFISPDCYWIKAHAPLDAEVAL
jgi:DNA-binding transcriptional regulator LsrR (DeoR family)